MKQCRKIIGIVVMLFIISTLYCMELKAEELYSEGYFLYTIVDNGIEIVNYFGNDKEVIIPQKIADITVKKIRDYAFINCKNVEKIKISHLVQDIGDKAFFGATNLTEIIVIDNNNEKDVSDKYLKENNTIVSGDDCKNSDTMDTEQTETQIEDKTEMSQEGEESVTTKNDIGDIVDNQTESFIEDYSNSKDRDTMYDKKESSKNAIIYIIIIVAFVLSMFVYFISRISK